MLKRVVSALALFLLTGCSAILGPHYNDTLRYVPPHESSARLDPIVTQVIPQFSSVRPHQDLQFAYNSNKDWEVMRHPDTGVILRRRLSVIFGYRCAGNDIGCSGTTECGVEMLQVSEEYLGGADRWGEPLIGEYQSPNTAMGYGAYLRYETCADVDKLKEQSRGVAGMWTKD
jgi:hypothetical protein